MIELIFAIIWVVVGGTVGVLVMSILTVNKGANDAELRIAFGKGYLTGRMHEHKGMDCISIKEIKEDHWQ